MPSTEGVECMCECILDGYWALSQCWLFTSSVGGFNAQQRGAVGLGCDLSTASLPLADSFVLLDLSGGVCAGMQLNLNLKKAG